MRICDAISKFSELISQNLDLEQNLAKNEVRIFLAKILSATKEFLILNSTKKLTETQILQLESYVKRRINFEPIAYIIEDKEFFSLNFKVNNHCLIPRPETELIIEYVINHYNSNYHDISLKNNIEILDLGTGSACIPISILKNIPNSIAVATDISRETLNIAKINAKNHDLLDRITFIESNWFDNIRNLKFDIIISNPPYISSNDKNLMSKEVLLFEPHSALFSDENGLSDYKKIAKSAKNFLKNNGIIILESGFNISDDIKNIFLAENYKFIELKKDLSKLDRMIVFSL